MQSAIADPFIGEDLDVLLINTGETWEQAQRFIEGAGTTLPCLIDPSDALYRSYPLGEASYAPFPLQVVIDRQGVIRYLARQYDADAARTAIRSALAAPE